uniref:Uncharacterized protein n=1 Tax=Sinocyclocheilus grahami TaxID=75366 RepID=A0A672S1K8_SINGR
MDSDCLSLLPEVCLVLADPQQSPPDDTSLEKLLDWFKELHIQSERPVLLQHQPCLLEFISSVCTSKTTDPAIISFTLKLTGLLAATKQGFHLLEVRPFPQYIYTYLLTLMSSTEVLNFFYFKPPQNLRQFLKYLRAFLRNSWYFHCNKSFFFFFLETRCSINTITNNSNY